MYSNVRYSTTGSVNSHHQKSRSFSAILLVRGATNKHFRTRCLQLTGWLCAIGWQVYLAGVCFMIGSILQGLIALNGENYEWHNWHGTLLTIAVIAFSIVFNTALASRLPLIEGMVLILHIAGFFGIIIPLWVMAPRAHPRILIEFTNNGGWSSTGLSAMIGLTAPLSVLIGYDCSVHMCRSTHQSNWARG